MTPPTTWSRRDRFSGLALFAFALVYYAGSRGLPAAPPGTPEPGPAFFPRILAALLAVIGLLIASRGLRRSVATEPPRGRSDMARPMLLAVTMALAIATIPLLGFGLPMLALSAATVALARGRSVATLVLVPVLTTLALYAIFALGLGIPLPFWNFTAGG